MFPVNKKDGHFLKTNLMITHNLGYPRIGAARELKKASEAFWNEKITMTELQKAGEMIRLKNWQSQKEAGIDIIPSNDFSFYDHVLDMSFMLGAIPVRFRCLRNYLSDDMEFYFAMARGYQKDGFDIRPMEMTKWFDTNYHYIVPEFRKSQGFEFLGRKAVEEFIEAKKAGFITKPVLVGPLSYVLLGKCESEEFDRLDILPALLPVYLDILYALVENGAEWIQLDEPFLATSLGEKAKELYNLVYKEIRSEFPQLKILLTTYFDSIVDNIDLAVNLPVDAIHLDLVRAPEQLEIFLQKDTGRQMISLGVVDGRNVWKNDFALSLRLIHEAVEKAGEQRIMIAPSCSLIHSPIDLDLENDEEALPLVIRDWLAFARQKLDEVESLREIASQRILNVVSDNLKLHLNQESINRRKTSALIHNEDVKNRLSFIPEIEKTGRSSFSSRKIRQQKSLNLPLFPTTTIGSFPQTAEVRSWRSKLKKGELDAREYDMLIGEEIRKAVKWQEEAGFDVLVHGEFERNDMVEYFGELLEGFAFTRNGWIQSYGSRYVKPPVIYGDVWRSSPMTIGWITYAQSLTAKPVKGMLTGPVTILQWSFVRDDQPRAETCFQIALAIRDEVLDLEKAGIRVIQIDEPALREGLPIRNEKKKAYLEAAVRAFRLSYAGVRDETQVHTHMCYSEFSDIMEHIAALDADVLTIECSRSNMELLDVFGKFNYPNDIGPGIYDIHSPRIPSIPELESLISKAAAVIPESQLWINPDCGLKTRNWDEVKQSLSNMLSAVKKVKQKRAVEAR